MRQSMRVASLTAASAARAQSSNAVTHSDLSNNSVGSSTRQRCRKYFQEHALTSEMHYDVDYGEQSPLPLNFGNAAFGVVRVARHASKWNSGIDVEI